MLKLFKKPNRIERFWDWFAENANRLSNFQTNPDAYLQELISQAKRVSHGLALELEAPKDGTIRMTISADGDINLFPVVEDMVNQAPSIEGWQFLAFRQRLAADKIEMLSLNGPDHKIALKDMRFFPISEGEELDIIVYMEGLNEANRDSMAYGCLLLLDNILGEYDCVMKVDAYDFHPMPGNQQELEGTYPLTELADYVDDFHQNPH